MALGIRPGKLSSVQNPRWDREKANPKAQLFNFAPVLTEQIATDVKCNVPSHVSDGW